jgi:hypothetical protein
VVGCALGRDADGPAKGSRILMAGCDSYQVVEAAVLV